VLINLQVDELEFIQKFTSASQEHFYFENELNNNKLKELQ